MPGKLVSSLFKYSKPKQSLNTALGFATNWGSEWVHTNLGRNTQSKAQGSSTSTFSNQLLDKCAELWNRTLTTLLIDIFPAREAAAKQGFGGKQDVQ